MKKEKVATLLLVLGIVTAGFVAISKVEAQPAGGNILYVGGSGANNYTKIQDAINDASANDTIKVEPGLYKENLTINKPLKIIGDPIIDANGSLYGIRVEANDTLIENLTIYNYTEAGIYVYNAPFTIHNVTINNCIIHNSTYNTGKYGIKFNHVSNSLINKSYVYNNSEAGIYLSYSTNNTVYNNTVNNNTNGGGIFLYLSSNNTITNNTVNNNEDGIFLYLSSNNTITNNTVNNNTHGIYLYRSSNITITNNTANNNGWNGVQLYYSSNITITNNTANNNGWNGIYLYSSSNNTIIHNTVNNNTHGIDLELHSNNTIIHNTVNNNSYGIYLYRSLYNTLTNNTANNNSYGIYLSYSSDNNLTNNTASSNCYGIYLWYSSSNNLTDNILSWNLIWDLNITGSPDNTLINNMFSLYPYQTNATISAYSGNFNIKGVTLPPADPAGFKNVSKFLNITGDEWINITIYYDESYVSVDESTLHVWKWNGTAWLFGGWYNYHNVDTLNDTITFNITSIDDPIFAPLEEDLTPPTTTKVIGNPNYNSGTYVTTHTPIWLNATDDMSGVNATYYRIWYNNTWHPANETDYYGNNNITYNGSAYWYVYCSYNASNPVDFGPIHFCEECMHYLVYYSIDNMSNEELKHNQTHYVDNTPPNISKQYGKPYYMNNTGAEYITSNTPIYINASDNRSAPCIVGSVHVNVSIYSFLTESWTYYEWHNYSDLAEINEIITLPEECKHWINITAWDDLNNTAYLNQTVFVDNTPPVATVDAITPYSQEAPVTINVTAYDELCASGVKNVTLYYRFSCYNDSWSSWYKYGIDTNGNDGWSFMFTAPNGSGFYQFEAVAVDNLGNKETFNGAKEAILCVEFNITYGLHKGWNLITVPIAAEWHAYNLAKYINQQAIKQYGYPICDTIVMLDALHQRHIGWVITEPDYNNFTIQPGVAYWVFLHENLTTFYWVGSPIENITVQLQQGFNLVGWANHCGDTNASEQLQSIGATMIIGYNSVIQEFVIYTAILGNNFDITIGRGYYVYVTTSSTWYGGRN